MDVEKVIKDLKEVKHEVKVGTASRMINDSTNAIDNAIWTIRELQSKSEEVCEWRIVDRPNGFPIFNTSCGAIRLTCAKGIDIYCNACGRKIKVVSE